MAGGECGCWALLVLAEFEAQELADRCLQGSDGLRRQGLSGVRLEEGRMGAVVGWEEGVLLCLLPQTQTLNSPVNLRSPLELPE